MAEFPQLPIHVQRWLSELPDLTLEEHGVYFLTILQMWLQPDCGMPTDPEWLRKKLRIHPKKWLRLWPFIRSFMTEVDGRLYQKTLCEERQYLRDKRVKGKRDASKRWETFHANSLKYNDATDATQHQKTDAPTPTPTPTQERKKESIAQKSDSASDWPTDFEHQFWQAYPRKIGKQAAMRALARVKKTKAVPWASMLLAINKFSTWASSKETRFVKHPATWLNAGCWDDELEINGGTFNGQAALRFPATSFQGSRDAFRAAHANLKANIAGARTPIDDGEEGGEQAIRFAATA